MYLMGLFVCSNPIITEIVSVIVLPLYVRLTKKSGVFRDIFMCACVCV